MAELRSHKSVSKLFEVEGHQLKQLLFLQLKGLPFAIDNQSPVFEFFSARLIHVEGFFTNFLATFRTVLVKMLEDG